MNYQTDLIIVNFNTKKLLVNCLESIRRHTGLAEDYRLWVIDNHSTDGSASLLHNLRWVNSIFNRQNLGYATACNQGIKAGKGKGVYKFTMAISPLDCTGPRTRRSRCICQGLSQVWP